MSNDKYCSMLTLARFARIAVKLSSISQNKYWTYLPLFYSPSDSWLEILPEIKYFRQIQVAFYALLLYINLSYSINCLIPWSCYKYIWRAYYSANCSVMNSHTICTYHFSIFCFCVGRTYPISGRRKFKKFHA